MVPSVQKKKNHEPLHPSPYTARPTPDNFPPSSPSPEISLITSLLLPLPTVKSHPTFIRGLSDRPTAPMSQSLVPPMPTHGECGAPQFDPTKLRGLCRFFDNLRFQFMRSEVVDEVEMKGHALRFVDCDTAELWEILPEFADSTAPYQKFVNAVCQLYPGSDAEQHWLIADMEKLVADTSRTRISSLADLGKYHRDFVSITMFLITKNCLATPKQSRTFTRAFPLELWSQVSYRLQLKFPNHFPDDPYTLEQIHDAAHFVLHGTTAPAHAHFDPCFSP